MKKIRLTPQRIARAAVAGQKSRTGKKVNQVFIWDSDVKGLATRVTIAGVKSFVFQGRLKLEKKDIRLTIGSCSAWTLDKARTEARRLQMMIDQNIDPRELVKKQIADKAAKTAAAEANKKYTLKALLQTYTDHLAAQNKKKSCSDARSVIKVHVLQADHALSQKPANAITADEIFSLIRRVQESGKSRTAGILRSVLYAAYNCGIKRFDSGIPSEFRLFNIVSNPVAQISAIPVNAGNRTLSKDELKGYLAALGDSTIDLALKLALFAGGQRMAQVLRAEVNDWNEDTRTLRLTDPKGRRRTPREHLLPLGPVASGIIAELVRKAKGKDTIYLFASKTNRTPIDVSMTGPRVAEISAAIGNEKFDLRDIRRTVETMLAGVGVSKDIRAQLLSHGISGVQAVHYDKYSYGKEKHAALLKWERQLHKIIEGEENGKVIPFVR